MLIDNRLIIISIPYVLCKLVTKAHAKFHLLETKSTTKFLFSTCPGASGLQVLLSQPQILHAHGSWKSLCKPQVLFAGSKWAIVNVKP